MKNILIKSMAAIMTAACVAACDGYLDVVPNDTPNIDHAFANRSMTERFLFSCYAFLPDPTNPYGYPAYLNSFDEFNTVSILIRNVPAVRIAYGEQNINAPYQNYWSGGNGGVNLYQAIRMCNTFLENVHKPKDMKDKERSRWTAEAKFLKAWYHFFLLQLYGPIPLIKDNLPLSSTPEETMLFREPVDTCANYIVSLLNEAIPDLPEIITNNTQEDGRITRPIALSVKAKVLATVASPLFNGNEDYRQWKDKRDVQLVSDTYSSEKWARAAEAIEEAITACHDAGMELYRFNKNTAMNAYGMNDTLVKMMSVRKAITERWNRGIIWSDMHTFGYKGYVYGFDDLQWNVLPCIYPKDGGINTGVIGASTAMAELFYTNKGIPINEDPAWNYAGRYDVRTSDAVAQHGSYIPLGEKSVALHFNREPRFYADLGFDRGYFEIASTTDNGGKSFSVYLKGRSGEPWCKPFGYSCYAVKKMLAYETSTGSEGGLYLPHDYRWPLLRLADLYLLYSEALNEIKDKPDAEVYEWIDRVRAITGLKGVVEAWAQSSRPTRPTVKEEMRKIIRQERLIELAFEGQRFWDLRRWRQIEDYWTVQRARWNPEGITAEEYYVLVPYDEKRKITVRDYLWPVSIGDLRINQNLVQTWGW